MQQEMKRRGFLGVAGLAAGAMLASMGAQASGQTSASGSSAATRVSGRRRLGALEVSSVGLGVQNMSRTYHTTVPYRPEMINIIRTAFDRGVTFFDAAEAYGPHEVERILVNLVERGGANERRVQRSGDAFHQNLSTGPRRALTPSAEARATC